MSFQEKIENNLNELSAAIIDIDEKDNQEIGQLLIQFENLVKLMKDEIIPEIDYIIKEISKCLEALILNDIDPVDDIDVVYETIFKNFEDLSSYITKPAKRESIAAKIKDNMNTALSRSAEEQVPLDDDIEPEQEASQTVEETITSEQNDPYSDLNKQDNQDEDLDMNDEDDDIFLDFLQETNEYIEVLENEIIDLESDPTNKEIINNVFRPFHTLKGVSGFMGLKLLTKISHETENLLDMARNDKLAIDESIIQGILNSLDMIKSIVNKLSTENRKEQIDESRVDQQINLLKILISQESKPADLKLDLTIHDDSDDDEEAGEKKTAAKSNERQKDARVKVKTDKLDYLVDMVGELVINANLVAQDKHIAKITNQEFLKKLSHMNRVVSELQNASMALRMIPIASTFSRMKRVVRDYTHKSGKKINLVLKGEDTEIDRNIVDSLYDPLVHMIRNSCDHGIEDAQARKETDKPKEGTITLEAYHKGNNIVIDVIDDGKGLDKEAILERAIERGLAKPTEQLTDQQIFQFIMMAGFSTAKTITNVSGRGVGMDVVNQTLKNLGGRVDIKSERGKGSTFSISLPLTLAIIEGMLVKNGDELFIIPVINVKRTLKPDPNAINKIVGKGETLNLHDNLIPILKLHEVFDTPNAKKNYEDTLLIIVAGGKGKDYAILVDQLIGIQDVVIKSLGEKFKKLKGISGATILGDGSVGLILDVNSLHD